MPQLLLISAKSMADDGRQIGDIVNILPDGWKFSAHEQEVFTIIKTTIKIEVIQEALPKILKYEDPVMPMQHAAWQDSEGNWKRIVEKPRFEIRWENNKAKENFSRIQANTENPVEIGEIG